jgi:hypothetical protein
MSKNLRFGLMAAALATLFCGGEALASGGSVKLKTDNGPDGYYYNANGTARARYGGAYNAGEFDINAIICGIRIRDLDQSTITPGVDDYILRGDIRTDDPLAVGYADISALGLIATTDAGSALSCTTTGAASTQTFNTGAGIADPGTRFVLTCSQPGNNDVNIGLDFCGMQLDTSSVFVNSARTQNYAVADGALYASIGFNHFVEAVVFEPKLKDLNIRLTGSSRYPADRGLPVMFARRVCDVAQSNCVGQASDTGPVTTTDDFITARVTMDNNTASSCAVNLTLLADRSVINPKLTPKDVTAFFRPCAGGPPIMNPLNLPANSRTNLCLEIKTAIGQSLLGAFPIDLPFLADISDANLVSLDSESQKLGIRKSAGYYDNNSHAGGYFFSQSPVQTGDALIVRYDAIDLQNRANTATPYRLSGVQYVSGEFGASGLAGVDGLEARLEDPVVPGAPDLSPSGLLRAISTIGDPGNADGIASGAPPTTTTIDFTDIVITPGNFALANNSFCMCYLNPGDTLAAVTAVGATGGGDVFIGNSATILGGNLPIAQFTQNDLEIRVDENGLLGTTSPNLNGQVGSASSTLLRTPGQFIAIDKNRNRID